MICLTRWYFQYTPVCLRTFSRYACKKYICGSFCQGRIFSQLLKINESKFFLKKEKNLLDTIWLVKRRLTNDIRFAAHSGGSGLPVGQVISLRYIPTPPYSHILPALVLLRKPLFGLAKRRISVALNDILQGRDFDIIFYR